MASSINTEVFKNARVHAGLSQADVAKFLGVSPSVYSRIEASKGGIKAIHMLKLMEKFDLKVQDLLVSSAPTPTSVFD